VPWLGDPATRSGFHSAASCHRKRRRFFPKLRCSNRTPPRCPILFASPASRDQSAATYRPCSVATSGHWLAVWPGPSRCFPLRVASVTGPLGRTGGTVHRKPGRVLLSQPGVVLSHARHKSDLKTVAQMTGAPGRGVDSTPCEHPGSWKPGDGFAARCRRSDSHGRRPMIAPLLIARREQCTSHRRAIAGCI
jgi:hypothetical protein